MNGIELQVLYDSSIGMTVTTMERLANAVEALHSRHDIPAEERLRSQEPLEDRLALAWTLEIGDVANAVETLAGYVQEGETSRYAPGVQGIIQNVHSVRDSFTNSGERHAFFGQGWVSELATVIDALRTLRSGFVDHRADFKNDHIARETPEGILARDQGNPSYVFAQYQPGFVNHEQHLNGPKRIRAAYLPAINRVERNCPK